MKIRLHNRYSANIWLEHIDQDLWQIKSKKPEDLDYMRVIYDNDDSKKIYAIDPAGGPFLCIGSEFINEDTNYKIAEIFPNGYIFRLEKI